MKNIITDFITLNNIKYYAVTTDKSNPQNGFVFTFLAPYNPYDGYNTTHYQIDAYYEVSNRTYHMQKQLIASLNNAGFAADTVKTHNIRQIAANAGLGKIAYSGFLYNDDYGTYCFIAAVSISLENLNQKPDENTLNAILDLKSLPTVNNLCDKCGACVVACPVNTVKSDKHGCLRAVQEDARKGLDELQLKNARMLNGKLLGCDLCQRFCPLNNHISTKKAPDLLLKMLRKDVFPTLVEQNDLSQLKEITGSNYARKALLEPILRLLIENDK